MKYISRWIISPVLGLGLILGATFAARAQTTVTFQVDMSAQIANSNFDPLDGDRMQARGSFQGWTGGFWLTNSPAHPNIYSAAYAVAGMPGTIEQYKFVILKNGDDSNSWNNSEGLDIPSGNRSFTVGSGGSQILPVVYYANQVPSGATATNPITFQVDMSIQLTNGNFNPGNGDQLEVQGDFETPPWTDGGILTNTPGNTNLYRGTFYDNNDPGAQLAYKVVILPGGGGDNYESLANNRVLIEPGTNGVTLPAVYFNNLGPPMPVVFQVDMSVQIAQGDFDPSFLFVQATGDFNGWGFLMLTNDPAAANTNLYTGVYGVTDVPGTVEQYKFIIGYGDYERPFSPTNDNRSFILASGGQTLPAFYFSDLGPSAVLSEDTIVTFTVNMTNAVGTDGVIFDPAEDEVYVNGDFLGWWPWGSFPTGNAMTQLGSSLIYSYSYVVEKGTPVELTYKYSINSADDEAPFKVNHIRYIRTAGSYTMPLDKFGNQLAEASFGGLKIGQPSAGHVLISWLGGPGVHLQTATNLVNAAWQDHPETDSLSSTNWAVGSSKQFFRLIKIPDAREIFFRRKQSGSRN